VCWRLQHALAVQGLLELLCIALETRGQTFDDGGPDCLRGIAARNAGNRAMTLSK
jgi:hypothetical protein